MFDDGLNSIQQLAASLPWAVIGKRLVTAIIIVGCAYLLVQALRFSFDRLRKRFTAGAPIIYTVEQLGAYTIMITGFLAGITALGVNLGSLTIFAGAVGVGLGLGLQGLVKEVVSGLALIFDPAIQIGDFVELEGGVRGEIVDIGPRATRLRTNDNLNVVIPNSTFIQSRVSNWTYNDASRRVHVPFSVAEESDIAKVRDVVLAAAKALPFTLPDDQLHKTQVWLLGFSGAGLDFSLAVWPTMESSRHPRTVHAAYTWAIYQALQAEGIGNANDQMEVQLRSLFGREGDDALNALNLKGRVLAEILPSEDAGWAPNDAATAMALDTDRDRLQRATEQSRRRQSPPEEVRRGN